MKYSLIICFITLTSAAFAQKWQPGYFYDIKGNQVPGLIQHNPGGKGPIKNEGFIIYKDNPKANEIKLSASDIKYYVIGKDSFIVAHPPSYEVWPKGDLDFVKVELDEPLKLYTYGSSSGGGGGFRVSPSFSGGFGTGGYGGAGVGINLGSGGGGGGRSSRVTYYFGTGVGDMSQVTPMNFIDVMTDIMADEPQAVEAIQQGKFNITKMLGLVNYYKQLKTSRKKSE
ncbi:hypothetical protein MUGA111182_12200 [Mucilaginibacter galii]|uniref:DUF4468 domain-containing protein n=1 Tax=Mucilaginibacter galii TaxID=2005073 RepID=A0A917N304_9SPHI|nr:hypothetical protein [Mucilaginibacter galii]GGI52024.1 hypothetical protein GCM10011425_32360 [Mucilaginibacter galii]